MPLISVLVMIFPFSPGPEALILGTGNCFAAMSMLLALALLAHLAAVAKEVGFLGLFGICVRAKLTSFCTTMVSGTSSAILALEVAKVLLIAMVFPGIAKPIIVVVVAKSSIIDTGLPGGVSLLVPREALVERLSSVGAIGSMTLLLDDDVTHQLGLFSSLRIFTDARRRLLRDPSTLRARALARLRRRANFLLIRSGNPSTLRCLSGN